MSFMKTLSMLRKIRGDKDPYGSADFSAFYHRVVGPSTHRMAGKLLVDQVSASIPEQGRVLEVGSGSGISAEYLARRRADLRVVASDLNKAMMAASEGEAELPPNLSRQQADAVDLPFEDGSFDAVFSANAIKHFSDRRRGVAEMLRVTRPGGLVLICEIAPWVPWRVSLRASANMPIPALLKPMLAAKARIETGRLIGAKSDVEKWFVDHADAPDFAGLELMEDAPGQPLPFFVATMRRGGAR